MEKQRSSGEQGGVGGCNWGRVAGLEGDEGDQEIAGAKDEWSDVRWSHGSYIGGRNGRK